MLVKMVSRLDPRDSIEYYKENPEIFYKLKAGESVEIPDEVAIKLKGVKEVKRPSPEKKLKKKLDSIEE